jgi:hypothetical protein
MNLENTMNEKIIVAIQQYGARAVHEAAVKRLEGSHLALEAVGLFAVTLGDANEILSTAHKLMSSAEQDLDHVDAIGALSNRTP